MNIIYKVKKQVAKEYGFEKMFGKSGWDYAMLITHRTKKQIEMYERVIEILADKEEKK